MNTPTEEVIRLQTLGEQPNAVTLSDGYVRMTASQSTHCKTRSAVIVLYIAIAHEHMNYYFRSTSLHQWEHVCFAFSYRSGPSAL